MKKAALLLIGLLAGILPSFAQIMPDSTVQVVAYWNVGDKYQYLVESVKSNIAEGDTTVVEQSAQLLEFEVVSADEEKGFRIKVTTLDSQNSDPTKATISEKMRERFGADVYYFEAGPYGEFLRVLPIEGLEKQSDALCQEITDAVLGKNPGLDRNVLLQTIRQMLNPETLMATFEGDISPLFMYHGARLGLKDEYAFEDVMPVPIAGGSLKMNGRFWVNESLTDEYSAVLQMYKEADQEQVKQFIGSFLGGIVKSLAGDQLKADEIPSLEEVYKDAKIEIEDFISEEIHLDTGWPIEWFFTRRTLIEMEGKSMNQLIKRSVSMLFEDDEE